MGEEIIPFCSIKNNENISNCMWCALQHNGNCIEYIFSRVVFTMWNCEWCTSCHLWVHCKHIKYARAHGTSSRHKYIQIFDILSKHVIRIRSPGTKFDCSSPMSVLQYIPIQLRPISFVFVFLFDQRKQIKLNDDYVRRTSYTLIVIRCSCVAFTSKHITWFPIQCPWKPSVLLLMDIIIVAVFNTYISAASP